MTERAFKDGAGSSSGPFKDPFHENDGQESPDTNAWESFLIGKEGSTPLTKENPISFLDHFEAVSNEANLLLGGLSPERPSLPDRHVRSSSSNRKGNGRNPRSNSASPPKSPTASPSISSPKHFSSSPTTYGAPSEETLEDKIARVMSGNYSGANLTMGSMHDAASKFEANGRAIESRRERDNRTESSFHRADESVVSYETIPLHMESDSSMLDHSYNHGSNSFEPLTPLPARLLLDVPTRSISAPRGREKEVNSLATKPDIESSSQNSRREVEYSRTTVTTTHSHQIRTNADQISPISKMIFGSPDGYTDSSPSSAPAFSNMKHSPQKPSTPNEKGSTRGMTPFDDDSSLPYPHRSVSNNTSPNTRRSVNVPRARSSSRSYQKTERESMLQTPTSRRRMSSSATSMNGSIGKGDKASNLSISTSSPVPASSLPLPSRVVKVAVRVRPFSQLELQGDARRIVSHCADKLVIVNPTAFDADPDTIALAAATVHCKEWAQVFRFNHVLWSHEEGDDDDVYVSQEGVHRAVGAEIVNNVLNGVSASCFAYGHTGTGKTYSLFGGQSDDMVRMRKDSSSTKRGKNYTDFEVREKGKNGNDGDFDQCSLISDDSGLIPRILYDVIEGMRTKDLESEDSEMNITFSFLEIYNEKIRDLLLTDDESMMKSANEPFANTGNGVGPTTQSAMLRVREHPVLGPYVEGLTKPTVHNAEDALRLLAVGLSRRSTTQTAWNAHSSRSHAVVTVEISHAGKYAEKAFATGSIDARSHLFSPTVSFTRSTKCGNGLSPECSGGGDMLSHSVTSLSMHPGTVRDTEHDNRHFVRVQLVDLAGSERDPMHPGRVPREGDELDLMAATGPSSGGRHGKRSSTPGKNNSDAFGGSSTPASSTANINEMRMIRRSLSTLGYIIKALGQGEALKSLPYRDSVLTWLLRDALSGRNHTTMLATLSPAHTCHDESLNTLKYAERLCQATLKGSQFKGSESSHGFSSVTSSTSKDVTQLKQQQQQAPSAGREGWTYEYGKIGHAIHDNLGGNRPGTLAARMLLRRTITDPQQRLAKIGMYKPKYVHGVLAVSDPDDLEKQSGGSGENYEGRYDSSTSHSPSPSPSPKTHTNMNTNTHTNTYAHTQTHTNTHTRTGSSNNTTSNVTSRTLERHDKITKEIDREKLEESAAAMGLELDGLKNAYRSLHGQHIEREIELEAARTDRDSLMVELKSARESVAILESADDGGNVWNRGPGSRSAAAASDLRDAVETGERDNAELRAVITRKELAVDRLLTELSEEKQERDSLERATQNQAVEFLARLEKLQRENDSLLGQLSQSMMRSEEVPIALAAIKAERDLLNEMNEKQHERTAEYLELLEEASTSQTILEGDLRTTHAAFVACQKQLLTVESECNKELARQRGEVAAITRDRDALIAVIDQQEVALQLQNRQSDAAMKALEQRQAALERSEKEVVVAEDELSRLQRGLTEFMSREGVVTGETYDARRFVKVITEVRERLIEADSVHDELEEERGRRIQLERILESIPPTPPVAPTPKPVIKHTHTMATQTLPLPTPTPVPPSVSAIDTSHRPSTVSTASGSSTSDSDPSSISRERTQEPVQVPKVPTPRSHAEVQMRLQAFSIPTAALSNHNHHNNNSNQNQNHHSSTTSTSHTHSHSSVNNSSVVHVTQSRVESQQLNLLSQQQQQFQQLMEQLEQQIRATESSEQRAQYWQSVAENEQSKLSSSSNQVTSSSNVTNTNLSTSNRSTNISIIRGAGNEGSSDSLKAENKRLKEELEHMASEALAASADLRNSKSLMQKEVWSSKEELRVSREGMQGELASLWMAVQELNKLDAVKEKKMQELLCDRDAAIESRDSALKQLEEMTDNYNELQTELQAIDADLLEAVDAVVDSQHHTRLSPRNSPSHQGLIGTIMGTTTKSMVRHSSSEDTHSVDNHNIATNSNGTPSVRHLNSTGPGSCPSSVSRPDYFNSKQSGSPNTNLPSLPLHISPSASSSNGLHTSSRSFHSTVTTHSHSLSHSHNQSMSHSLPSRGAVGGAGRGHNQSPEARATLGEKILEKQISELSEFLDHDRARLDSQQKRARIRAISGSQP